MSEPDNRSGVELRNAMHDARLTEGERLAAALKLIDRLHNRARFLEERCRVLSASVAELSLDTEVLQSRGNKIAHFREVIETARQDEMRRAVQWLGENLGIYRPDRPPAPDISHAIAEAIFDLIDEYSAPG